MRRKLQLCLRCSRKFLLGLFSSVLTILILFTIANSNNNNNNINLVRSVKHDFVKVDSIERHSVKQDSVERHSVKQDSVKQDSAPSENISYWTVVSNAVVVPVGSYPNPHDYTYVLNNTDLCRTFDPNRTKLLIFVESHADNVYERGQIRNTWGVRMLQTALNFRLVFLLGRSTSTDFLEAVKQEHFLYGDVLQEDFPEKFTNLGLKSVMGLKWSSKFCHEADYVMKTDEDIFVHVPNLLKMLAAEDDRSVIFCHKNRARNIVRRYQPGLKRYEVPAKVLPGAYFPEYCGGFGYAMSMAVVDALYSAALKTPYFFIEDVYVTGFCRYKADIAINDRWEIALKPTLTPMQAGCAFDDGRITSHELAEKELTVIWEQLNTRGYFCPQLIDSEAQEKT